MMPAITMATGCIELIFLMTVYCYYRQTMIYAVVMATGCTEL